MTRTRKTPPNPRRPAPTGHPPADATVAQIVAWVGSDRRRAQAAHDAETHRGNDARTSLLTQLSRLGAVERNTP